MLTGRRLEDGETEEFRFLIAENLKRVRSDRGLTQAQLAEAAHVEIHTYQRYEYADINIPMSKAIRITAALDCTLDELLAPSGPPAALRPEDLVEKPRPVPLRPRRTVGGHILQRVLKTLRRAPAKAPPKKSSATPCPDAPPPPPGKTYA